MVSSSYKTTSSNMIGSFANAAGSGSENTLAERPTRRSFAFVIAFSMFLAAAPALAGKPTWEHGIKWHKTASLSKIGSFTNADGSGAENLAYDARTRRLFVTNTEANTVDVLSLSDPTNPVSVFSISAPVDREITDVKVRGHILAVALPKPCACDGYSDPKAFNGFVAFYNAKTGEFLNKVEVGVGPDEVQFSPDGTKLAVSNPGDLEYNEERTAFVDPPGSISLIDLSRGPAKATVRSVDFSHFDGKEDKLRAKGIRIRPDAASSADLSPEGIAFAPHGELWATLQQNNAIAIISVDKRRMKIKRLLPLGAKDHSLPGNGLDASDRDGEINIANWPVFGLYTPDEIDRFTIRDKTHFKTYFIITNEGNPTHIPVNGLGVREDETIRVKDLGKDGEDGLDPSAFPDATDLVKDENLGRLQVSRFEGDTDGDGNKDVLYAYGARSFSILDDKGNRVFDSGDDSEQIVADRIPTLFNAAIDANDFDDRSDNRGPQPEGIAIGKVEGRTYAFIGLHTQGGIMAYDVTDPKNARFVDYINTRKLEQVGGDLGTKGLIFIGPDDSPTGKALIAAACSESGTVAIYEFAIHRHGD